MLLGIGGMVVEEQDDEEEVVLWWWTTLMVPMRLWDVLHKMISKAYFEKAI